MTFVLDFCSGFAGRGEDSDDEEFAAMERFLGPTVVAIIANPGTLREELVSRVEAAKGISISSCEKLLETRGIAMEGTDTLIFCGDEQPLDRATVERLIGRSTKLRFVVLVSSLGTRRSDLFPFSMQNAFTGVLDKKRDVELGVEDYVKELGASFVVVRVGKLSEDRNLNNVKLEPGDEMSSEVTASSAAEAVMQSVLQQPFALNSTFSISGVSGPKPSQVDWDDQFSKLNGPELWRQGIGTISVKACRDWVQTSWAQEWGKSGSGLTTPVEIVPTAKGVQLVFRPNKSTFKSFKEEKAEEKAREKGDTDGEEKTRLAGDLEGGVEVVVEEQPFPRIRAMRCNMGPNTVIKEMSEQIMMTRLKKDVDSWMKKQ
ncbi:hypothetical protein T484DRAFT_2522203 [Baffinella frigidus]|nr:hypothetical protein T484DRAFT_2522203 [Cryptophyta sp. CCMP2293]